MTHLSLCYTETDEHIYNSVKTKQKNKKGKTPHNYCASTVIPSSPAGMCQQTSAAFCAALVMAENWLSRDRFEPPADLFLCFCSVDDHFIHTCSVKMGCDLLGSKLKLVLSGFCFVRGKGGEAINLLLSCLEEGGVHSRTGSHTLVH